MGKSKRNLLDLTLRNILDGMKKIVNIAAAKVADATKEKEKK